MSETKDIPEHWEVKKLGEVCEIIMGQSPPSSSYNSSGLGMPFFQGKAEFTELYPIVEKWCDAPKKIALPNDILLSVRAPVGTTNIANQKCCIGRGLAVIRYENYKYVFYFLRSIEQQLDKKGTGTTFRAISGETIRTTDIPLPPIPEQQAIVAKIEELLSELDNGKEQLQIALQQLKVYRQSLLKWAFEGKLTNDNVKDGELPQGWKWVIINDIGKIKGGKRLPPKHQYSKEPTEYIYIMAGNLKDGTVKNKSTYIIEETFNVLSNYKVTGGEVYITIVGACIGDAGVIPENIGKAILTENAAKIIELKNVQNKYLSRWINSHDCQVQIKRKILSATLGKLALNRIGTIEVPLPPLDEQQLIVDELESKLTVCDKVEETINQSLLQTESLRQSILKKAFEGKLV